MAEKSKGEARASADASELRSERGDTPMENVIAPLVASPTGPVPVSALVASEEEAEELREEREEQLEREREHPRASDKFGKKELEDMSGPDLRAIRASRERRGGSLREELTG
jgi:hypothetical protein